MKLEKLKPVNPNTQVEHFFRHEYGRLVAILSAQVGVHHLEATEDAVQFALLKGLETWTASDTPSNPTAWLFRVAKNELLGKLRQNQTRSRNLAAYPLDTPSPDYDELVISMPDEIQDELLLMLFVCCNESIPIESQLVFALKTLCGFNIHEIAQRLFISEANVYKRLSRARTRLREQPSDLGELSDQQYTRRLPAVNKVLYVLFTEGYLSSHAEHPIRKELCEEAIRITTLLANHPVGALPATFALLSLMYLHTARLSAREDASGGLLLLEEQDRSNWDNSRIQLGLMWLARSAEGQHISRYHAEAGIAAEHCLAPSFAQTNWARVCENYELLDKIAPSALNKLNRAVALAELHGPEAALAALQGLEPPSWLTGSYQWFAVLGDLHRRCGNTEQATRLTGNACSLAPSPAIKSLIARRANPL